MYYEFVTIWRVEAPIEAVWEVINDSQNWSQWWRGVLKVKEIKNGDQNGVGDIFRSRWRSRLPYTLEFDSEVVRVEHLKQIEARAFGELEGSGIWTLTKESENVTNVRYDWRVKTTKAWMNWFAPIAKPFFRWNHDAIMRWGAEGLAKKLNCRLLEAKNS